MPDHARPSVSLVDVDASNWRDVTRVAPAEAQREYVAETAYYLCLCTYGDDWNPVAITVEGEVVGFAMWAVDTDGSRWIGGLVVDEASQGQGVGAAAVEALIARLSAQDGCTGIALSYQPSNTRARELYQRLGFVETGEVDDDEVIARRSLD